MNRNLPMRGYHAITHILAVRALIPELKARKHRRRERLRTLVFQARDLIRRSRKSSIERFGKSIVIGVVKLVFIGLSMS